MNNEEPMLKLTPEQEERAQRLHRESLIMFCHDHDLFPEDLERMRRGGVTAKQVHICLDGLIWNDREAFYASAQQTEGYLWRGLAAMDYVYWQVEHSQGRIILARTPQEIVEAKANGQIALLLGAEGPRLIENRLEVLRMLYRLGLRHLQLSWAWETTVGAPQSDKSGRGLTQFGRDLIGEMNRLGMIVDVSHLAYRSQYDALEVSSAPLLNSHTGASRINGEQAQLLPDDLLRAIAAAGGVLGIHFMSQMVKPGRHKATFDELMAQFEYIANLVGTEAIACGPDYLYLDPRTWENQGISVPFSFADGVEDASLMLNVTRGLVSRGFSDTEIAGMMGGNLLRLFESVVERSTPGPWTYQRCAEGIGACTGGATPL
jgi:membrane dipeptidase